jgi:hypothetical protein
MTTDYSSTNSRGGIAAFHCLVLQVFLRNVMDNIHVVHNTEPVIKKVKESCRRPSVAQRVPGGLGSEIS